MRKSKKRPTNPPFETIPQFDARGDYPACVAGLPKYEHPVYFHPLGLTDVCRDLNDAENLARALSRLKEEYKKEKRGYIPKLLILYN